MSDLTLAWVLDAAGYLQRSDLPAQFRQSEQKITPASVLIPLFRDKAEWHLLLIRRVANNQDRHSGQVAFPGGKRDEGDADEVAVALREAREEIGLRSEEVRVIGVLAPYETSSNFVVTPVVGVVPWPYPYEPQPTEVSRIFSIPLSWLGNRDNVELRDKTLNAGDLRARLKVVYYDEYDGELLWGASARMTLSLLKSLHSGEIDLAQWQSPDTDAG